MNKMRLLCLLAAIACSRQIAGASLTIYSTRSEWEAAVGTYVVEDFESYTDFEPIPDEGGVFTSQHFDIVIDANHGRIGLAMDGFENLRSPGISGTFFVGDVHATSTFPPHFNTIIFSRPISAFAANIGGLEDGGLRDIRILGESFRAWRSDDPRERFRGFIGVTSTTPFQVVDIRNAEDVLERYSMDEVGFIFVPEPAAHAILASAVMAASFLWGRARLQCKSH